MTDNAIDCLTCGACCFGAHDRYIRLLPDDMARNIPEDALHMTADGVFMRMQGGHCAQLAPIPGGGLSCAIYENRPTACRAFRAGSFECGRSRHHRMAQADAIRLPVDSVPATSKIVRDTVVIAAQLEMNGGNDRA